MEPAYHVGMLNVSCVQVRQIDSGVDLLGVMVGQNASAVPCPAVRIVDDQNGNIFVRASDVSLVVAKGRLLPRWLALPLET